jgi:presenilin-like A22 family membrane protease
MPYGLGPAISSFIILATFSTMSIALVLSYVQKRKLFLPALPPIILGTTIGYLIGYVCGIIII